MFGVTLPAASEWGRTRPIPRHVRPRLEAYVKALPASAGAEPITALEGESPTLRDLLTVLDPNRAGSRLADLPKRYRSRYEQRVAEVVARVKRELEEFQTV